ncbi:NAD-dependent histone deacetylase Sir2p [Monosporozyma unispora]|nr:NAD-dependent histone deacetylase sir2 [Kazachstania unispora]
MSSDLAKTDTLKRSFDEKTNKNNNKPNASDHIDTASKKPKNDETSDGGYNSSRERSVDDQEDDLEDNASIQIPYGGIRSKENEILKPKNPDQPVRIGKNSDDEKYVFPKITKEDTQNARMFLKYYGLRKFLDTYLPEELNSLYVYYLIKLLGFELKDKDVMGAVHEYISPLIYDPSSTIRQKSLNYEEFEDPLEKRHAVRLIKDLQKAINKVLSTRLRLSNFFKIEHFVDKLQKANKILVLTGAGVSTSLGIPDFRSSEGFYSKIKHLGLDDPQDVFNLDIFMQDPSVFYNIAHMVLPPENLYSPLHSFIKMLQDKGKLLRNYTQNIDNLESYAGIKAEKLVQCHGSFATASCITCHWQLPGEKIFDHIRKLELPLCPYCYQKRREYFPLEHDEDKDYEDEYGYNTNLRDNLNNNLSTKTPIAGTVLKSFGVLKPDITFFGEALPSKFHKTIREDILECDLLICIGTSLKVAPVSEIVNMVPAHVPQVLINRDPVKHAEFDLNLLGFCDDVAALIAQKCHWNIPHSNWVNLKNKKIEYVEKDKGFYNVFVPANSANKKETDDTNS